MAQIADIIKYEGDNSTFVWKHPCEDFNSLTQLIVHESQEAIFFMNGQALDLFGPGRYTLETQNIPKIGRALNRTTGGKTPFHCEVYFINKTVQMAIKWGTDSKVRFLEPTQGIPLELGASGEMNLMVSDSRRLLTLLVGTMKGIAWDNTDRGFTKSIQSSFRPLISTAVKTHLAGTIKTEKIDILEIDQHLEQLSQMLKERISPGFEEYGLTIPQFYVTTVVLPESDPNFKRLKELHAVSFQTRIIQGETTIKTTQADAEAEIEAARRKIEMERQLTETEVAKRVAERELIRAQTEAHAARMAGLAEAEVMRAKGYSQEDVLRAEVQKAYAEGIGQMGANSGGGGGMVGDFASLGVGLAAAGAIVPQMSEMFKGFGAATPASAASTKCVQCGAVLTAGAKFCQQCGERVTAADDMIPCPNCGKTIPKGKFCMECGYQFRSNCPKCNTELAIGAKFCPECGEKL